MIPEPYPELGDLLTMIGDTGRRMAEIDASEGAAGNISLCIRWPLDPHQFFPNAGEMALPQPVPALAGATFLVTGSGRRLRELSNDPPAHIACLQVNEGGQTARLYTSPHRRFERVTSEFNSHLAVHADQLRAGGANFHAVVHAQPIHLTYLSHIPRYSEPSYLNKRLLRWQPETILSLPEGIGVIPFCLPGSMALMGATVEGLREHRIVVWAKHGVMARSDVSVKRAADRVEYAETAAKYEYLDLLAGGIGEGLSAAELRAICQAFGVQQSIF